MPLEAACRLSLRAACSKYIAITSRCGSKPTSSSSSTAHRRTLSTSAALSSPHWGGGSTTRATTPRRRTHKVGRHLGHQLQILHASSGRRTSTIPSPDAPCSQIPTAADVARQARGRGPNRGERDDGERGWSPRRTAAASAEAPGSAVAGRRGRRLVQLGERSRRVEQRLSLSVRRTPSRHARVHRRCRSTWGGAAAVAVILQATGDPTSR